MRCGVCRQPLDRQTTGRPRRYCSDACRQRAYRYRHRRRGGYMQAAATDEWTTPRDLFDRLNDTYGPFTLDVAATEENALCERFFTRADDGLAQPWEGRVWCNPPYGRPLAAWMAKAAGCGAELVCCLVPARTDTRWWHEHAVRGKVEFVSGRLRFGGAFSAAPFPSAVVVFRHGETVTEPSREEHGVPVAAAQSGVMA